MPAAPPAPERAQEPAARRRPEPADRAGGSYPASAITVREGSPGESKQTVGQNAEYERVAAESA